MDFQERMDYQDSPVREVWMEDLENLDAQDPPDWAV